ncbi:mip1 [Coprinopsis cinerea okayama7|uniref:Mip1 n=1 Tax=Coprinopsis cinerea (strain Okayama-7 / 130 / ATCC MYA-4618 / FGSC 9003) TaxID=240176 RepID=A8N3F8_COPC7|nr:mip1 [Coprinopsis cinerea okayama7\|eukprot:XP_001829483.2 mip1 [Coprinopsis cinerea okayama7\
MQDSGVHMPRKGGSKFTTEPWHKSSGSRLRSEDSDSDTERDYRSHSRSDPSSQSRPERGRHRTRSPHSRPNGSVKTLDSAPPIPYWSAKRHLTCGNPTPGPPWSQKPVQWRGSTPGRLKTAAAALVMCLNIDVDPPDIVKTNPCAVLECWVDPRTMPTHKALEHIGSNLQHQFEGLSLKIQYKPILDPSFEDLKRFVTQLRRQAGQDALLFYYNGHGVPKPTASGELWCFNRNYTQYIPVSLQELQSWVGSPGVYIWDCSAAGHLLQNFNMFAERRDQEAIMHGGYPDGRQPFMNSLQLAACAAHEQLPSCPELPADVFTSCLTSPIDIALRYFIMTHQLPNNITADMVVQLPGDLKDRRTPLGELNWIFTAITDTIAWTTFSREIFTKLYRSDLLIASLFRNFLLAERIMKNYHCTPHTWPPLPPTNTHPLWATWDLAVDTCLRQLPDLLFKGGVTGGHLANVGTRPGKIGSTSRQDPNAIPARGSDKPYVYQPSRFFADQLTAFEVWISRGGSALTRKGPLSLPQATDRAGNPEEPNPRSEYDGVPSHLVPRKPPDQLPIVLQVLLSQPHRLRALILLSQFVDLGPWAVHLVLTIGIFPYISKLLQAAGQDLRPVLIFIWARILAVDPSVQHDLWNSGGYKYFANILAIKNDDVLPNSSEHKAMCAFILSAISRDFPPGQEACLRDGVFDNCYDRLDESDFLLRQWTALCIGQIWDGNDENKVYGVDNGTQDKLIAMLSDDSAEVRCAALFALGTFLGASGSSDPNKQGGGGSGTMYQLEERVHFRMEVAVVTGATLAIKDDASPMCRKELLVVISTLVKEWRGCFVVCAWLYWEEDRKWRTTGAPYSADDELTSHAVAEWLDGFDDESLREEKRVLLSSFFTIFVVLLDLSVDPYQEVATNAQTIVDYIMALLLESPFTKLPSSTLHAAPWSPDDPRGSPQMAARSRTSLYQPGSPHPASPIRSDRPGLTRTDTMTSTISSGVTNTLRRTSSFANALKSLAFSTIDDGRTSSSIPSSSQLKRDPLDYSRPPSPNLNVAQYASPYSRPTTPPGTPHHHRPVSLQNSYENLQPQVNFSAADVMEALTEEDMERLRARRRASNHGRPRHHGGMPSPSNSTFSTDSNSSVILGLGTGASIRDTLPLKSTYFDWCCEYFKEPQMRQAEPDEPGSIQYNHQVWRQQRNEQVLVETATQIAVSETCRWDRPVAHFQIAGHPLTMVFHSYDQHLFVANEHDMIGVWDWSQRKRLKYFCNGNPRGTTITSLEVINQDVGGIILTGASDGIVRLFRNYDPTVDQGPLQMVSAFRGLNEMIQMRQGSGMVMDWRQSAGTLLVGGDSRVIKVWDAQTETQGMDLDTNSDSPVTAICSDHVSNQTFIASFADGVVKIFDRRLEDEDAIVRTYVDHTSWVQNVRWHPRLGGRFLSASVDGQVKVWDLRGADMATKTWDIQAHGLSAFDVHPTSCVFATSSAVSPTQWKAQRVSVHTIDKAIHLSSINAPTGLSAYPIRPMPSPYIPRSTSLVFHPTEMLYGVGEPDGSIRVMGCKFPPAQ